MAYGSCTMDKLVGPKMIRLSKSCISDTEKKAVMDVLDLEYLGMGGDVKKFEDELSSFFGRQVACVANGTAALQLALNACGIGKDDEVLVQSITYLASFQAVSATGATPVACDIDPRTITLDVEDLKRRLTEKTKAIMPVHYAGGVGALDKIYRFASDNKLRVIEDAAHAFGSTYQERKIGSFGDVACFSFDGIKNITSGEGGCIVTDDQKVLDYVRDARLLGVELDSEKRYKGLRSWSFDVKNQGWRYHMSNIMAALGSAQLIRFPIFLEKRRAFAKHYVEKLKNVPEIKLLDFDYNQVVPHIFPILLRDDMDRDSIQSELLGHGIQTGVHYQPNHSLSYYKNPTAEAMPATDRVANYLLSLPLHPDLSFEDVDFVVDKLVSLVAKDDLS